MIELNTYVCFISQVSLAASGLSAPCFPLATVPLVPRPVCFSSGSVQPKLNFHTCGVEEAGTFSSPLLLLLISLTSVAQTKLDSPLLFEAFFVGNNEPLPTLALGLAVKVRAA